MLIGDDTTEDKNAFIQRMHSELNKSRTIHHKFKQKASDDSLSTWLSHQRQKRAHIHNTCLKYSAELHENQWEKNMHYMKSMVDNNNKVVFCGIQKVASTTWIRIFSQLNGAKGEYNIMSKTMRAKGVVPLVLYSAAERKAILQNYTTFLMVRHPLERVVSAFQNKFSGNGTVQMSHQFKYGRDIARLYRNFTHALDESYLIGNRVSFTEFVRYLTDPKVPYVYKDNSHWTRYISLCPVCQGFRPDLNLSYNNFQEDVIRILKLLFRVDPSRYIDIRTNTSNKHSSSVYEKMLGSLPPNLYRKLLQFYDIDLKMYQYDSNKTT